MCHEVSQYKLCALFRLVAMKRHQRADMYCNTNEITKQIRWTSLLSDSWSICCINWEVLRGFPQLPIDHRVAHCIFFNTLPTTLTSNEVIQHNVRYRRRHFVLPPLCNWVLPSSGITLRSLVTTFRRFGSTSLYRLQEFWVSLKLEDWTDRLSRYVCS